MKASFTKKSERFAKAFFAIVGPNTLSLLQLNGEPFKISEILKMQLAYSALSVLRHANVADVRVVEWFLMSL